MLLLRYKSMSSKKKLKKQIKDLKRELSELQDDDGSMDLVDSSGDVIATFSADEASQIISKSVNMFLHDLIATMPDSPHTTLEGLLRRWAESRVAFDPNDWKGSQIAADDADDALFTYVWDVYLPSINNQGTPQDDAYDRLDVIRGKILTLACYVRSDYVDTRATIELSRRNHPELWRLIDDLISVLEN